MSVTVLVHVEGEDAIRGELDALPHPSDQMVIIHNPQRKDGKDLHYLEEEVTTLIMPIRRVNFIQVMPSAGVEEIIGFVRE